MYTSRYDETDSIRIYLKEIGRLPLLTAAQEIELAKTIAAGNAIGARLNLTRERIRQIQASALRKLRHPRIKAIVGGAL